VEGILARLGWWRGETGGGVAEEEEEEEEEEERFVRGSATRERARGGGREGGLAPPSVDAVVCGVGLAVEILLGRGTGAGGLDATAERVAV
jgi:hypothetical protein